MDPLTQGALGAAAAQLFLHNKDKKNAWLVGALAGMAPDLDIFIRKASDPMLALLYHRHFTHSLAFVPFGAIIVTLFLLLFQRFRLKPWWTLAAAFIGYATHGILDAFTSYGTVLYWPFSLQRVAFDLISIIDPTFTVPLVLGVAWALTFNNRKATGIGMLLACIVLIINSIQHYRVVHVSLNYAKSHKLQFTKLRAFPAFARSTQWRVIALNGKKIFLADVAVPFIGHDNLTPIASLQAFNINNLPPYVKDSKTLMRDFDIFNWFTDGYLAIAKNNNLVLVDARFIIGKEHPKALWGIEFAPGNNHITRKRFIALKSAS